MLNVHTHRNPKNNRNTDDLLGSGTKLLLPSLSLGFQHEESETQFLLCWLFHQNQQPAAHLVDLNRPHWAPKISTNCFFSKYPRIPAHRFRAWRHLYPQSYFLSGVFIMTSVIVTSSPREREHLRSMCAPTRALSRKVLSLTKPKVKI